MRTGKGRTVLPQRSCHYSLATSRSRALDEAQRREGSPRRLPRCPRDVPSETFVPALLPPALQSNRCAPRHASKVHSWIKPLGIRILLSKPYDKGHFVTLISPCNPPPSSCG